MEKKLIVSEEMHKKIAIECHNSTWDLMEKDERSDEENDLMINMAHASLYHWMLVGQRINTVRGEWLLSRVYAFLNMPEIGLIYAEKALKASKDIEDIKPYDLAFCYEAAARCYMLMNDKEKMQENLEIAEKFVPKVIVEDAKEFLVKELQDINID